MPGKCFNTYLESLVCDICLFTSYFCEYLYSAKKRAWVVLYGGKYLNNDIAPVSHGAKS